MSENKLFIEFFAKYIESQIGIIYAESNYFQLEHRLNVVAKTLGLPDIQSLYQQTTHGISGNMKAVLLNIATNNETSFFRDPQLFKCLSETIIPEITSRVGQKNISIWSCASSAGQEAYSVAMVVDQYRQNFGSCPELHILLSDISDTILKKAQDGIYSNLEVGRGLDLVLKNKYFESDAPDQWKVKSYLKKNMEYKIINLLDDWYGIGPFDIILCRNVLIYLSVENKKVVIEKLSKVLNPNGHLFLGSAESLFGLSEKFTQLNLNGTIVFKKK